jgi:lysophospholipase L1-like esterase
MKKSYLIIAAAAALSISACKSKINPDTPSPGEADFSTYVAIGNSLTAGFADGTLYRSGQENSYPSMLAGQFKLVGGGEFKQPLLPGEAGWPIIPAAGRYPKRVLGYATDCKGVMSLSPVIYSGVPDTMGSAANIASQGPFNNVGVPGIRCIDYVQPGYAALAAANGAPWAARFYQNPATQKPIEVALAKVPTFFTMWLGSNDVLGYALSGGDGAVSGPLPNDISPLSFFTNAYNSCVQSLVDIGAKGVLINIPDVTSIPYCTTVPPKGLALTSQAQVDALNAAYGPLGITFTLGANYFIIADPTVPGVGLRQIKQNEYVLLSIPQDSIKCGGWGSSKPIPNQYVLTAAEIGNIQAATASFNGVIAAAAAKHNLGLVDANAYMKTLQAGITWNGVTYSPSFVTGGAFSLDGVHLTPRGYGLIANEIIRIINQQYKSTVPAVDINKYHGILFP